MKKKLVLNKNTVKNMKIQTEVKAGATGSCGEVSRLDCQSRAVLTQTCANCFSASTTGAVGPTLGC